MKEKFNGSKLRWFIARILDKLPDTCWADLMLWATYPECHDFSEILDIRGTAGACHRMGEYNYCGKCDRCYPENACHRMDEDTA